jgi:hypothetical protein
MARRKQSEQTLHQRQQAELDKFRKQAYNNALNDSAAHGARNDDIDKFRRDQYREALREAKAHR